nr:sorting and assembly machinery component 50 homolog [Ipomoea batatas]
MKNDVVPLFTAQKTTSFLSSQLNSIAVNSPSLNNACPANLNGKTYRNCSKRARMESLVRQLSRRGVPVRVHSVLIKGNANTKDSLIEAELEGLKSASTVQELLQAASIANARLQQLGIFDSVSITLDAGPPELPGTATVVVEVAEAENFLTGNVGIFSKPEDRSWSLEGSLKLKNLVGCGDLWDGSLSYGWDETSEVSAGVTFKKFTPVTARLSLLSNDWFKFSSYKDQALGLSLGLLSSRNHELVFNTSWRPLTEPSQTASTTVRQLLGHDLLSVLKYTFKIDKRNSSWRPTRGYAFASTSQIGGLAPDYQSLCFLRQEFGFRYALPLGFYNAALNIGISAGAIFPWGTGSLNRPLYLRERFFMGGNSSPVFSFGGPISILGFKSSGLRHAEPQSQVREGANSESSNFSGDLAVTAFADLSFDLPLKLFRDAGIHGHAFACAGNLDRLTENTFRDLSLQKLQESYKASAGFGIVVPLKRFRMEVNYCHILKQQEHDRGKTGLQLSFSSSSSS